MQKFHHKSKEKKLDRFKEICQKHKIKLTPQRLVIYEELLNMDTHPSTDMVYQRVRQRFPTVSFDTVNRTLLTFSDIGVAKIIEGTGNPKRFDGNPEQHHHFQCLRCKKIFDVYEESYNELAIPQSLQNHYAILNVAVRLEGICDQCLAQSSEQKS